MTRRRNKKYRPRPIGRPVLSTMRRDLILPAYIAVDSIANSDSPQALETARHDLAALYNFIFVACRNSGRHEAAQEIENGLRALHSVVERHERTGTYRCTGPELVDLRRAVVVADETMPYLRTHEIQRAVLHVDRFFYGRRAA